MVRYRSKLTNMLVGEKNRTQNCLTVSNLKLDDVFGKSARSIIQYILAHPDKTFNVTPYVDRRCKTPIEETQVAVNGAISPEQAVKLRQCPAHIDELEVHRKEIEQKILFIAEPFSAVLDLLYTLPGLDRNPIITIAILSEISPDMSMFPSSKHLVSLAGCCPRNAQSNSRVKSRRISTASSYLKFLLIQVTNALTRSKKHPEFKERYYRVRSHRGHKKLSLLSARCS